MNDGRQSMVQRLKIVERERDGLEGARAAAEAYMDKERECTNAQCTIYQVHTRSTELWDTGTMRRPANPVSTGSLDVILPGQVVGVVLLCATRAAR